MDANDSGAFTLHFLELSLSFRFQRKKFVNHILKGGKCISPGNFSETSGEGSFTLSYNLQRIKAYHFQSRC